MPRRGPHQVSPYTLKGSRDLRAAPVRPIPLNGKAGCLNNVPHFWGRNYLKPFTVHRRGRHVTRSTYLPTHPPSKSVPLSYMPDVSAGTCVPTLSLLSPRGPLGLVSRLRQQHSVEEHSFSLLFPCIVCAHAICRSFCKDCQQREAATAK